MWSYINTIARGSVQKRSNAETILEDIFLFSPGCFSSGGLGMIMSSNLSIWVCNLPFPPCNIPAKKNRKKVKVENEIHTKVENEKGKVGKKKGKVR